MKLHLRPRYRHRLALASTFALVASTVGLGAISTRPEVAEAQASVVSVLVHTLPELPQPGEDLSVLVDIYGCAPGPVTAEVYLITTDGATETSTLVARSAARTTLLYRTRGIVQLKNPIEGWYGVRLLCGAYRPAKAAMSNSIFSVGLPSDKTTTLDGQSVIQGESLRFSGDGCPGIKMEYMFVQGARWNGTFEADGAIAVSEDGTWNTDLVFTSETKVGPSSVRSRCVVERGDGVSEYIYYQAINEVEVLEPTG